MDAQEQLADLQNLPPASTKEAAGATTTKQNEVVKRKSKRHEYVEVDGFHFRRKRRPASTPLAGAAAANAAAVGGITEADNDHQSPAALKHSLQLDASAQGRSPAKAAAATDPANDAAIADQDTATKEGGVDAAGAAVAPNAEGGLMMSAAEQAAASAAAAAAAAAAQAQAEAAAAAAAAAAALAAAEAAAADLEMVEASEEPAQQDDVAAGPVHFTMLPSELCHLVGAFLAAELHKLPGCSPDSAQQAADSIKQQLAQRLQQQQERADGCGQAADASQQEPPAVGSAAAAAGEVAAPLTVLPHQVEELKAKLVDKHSKLLQEQEAWVQLLTQYNDMADKAPVAGGAGADGTEAAAGAASPQQRQADNEQACEAGQGRGRAGDAAGTAEGTSIVVGSEEAGADSGEASAADGPVCAQQQESLLGVQLKVEVLTALVSKMEHLVGRAEATARALQAGYRAEKFSIFPHVDSPATLIKSLAGSSQPGADSTKK